MAEPKVKSVSHQQQRRRMLTVAGLGIAIGLVVLLVSSINVGPLKSGDWLKSLELKGYDWMMAHFPRPMAGAGEGEGPVAIVAIDQESIEQLGPWPWDRSLQARMVDKLHQAGARVIAIDILFSSAGSEAGDQALAGSMERAGNVVIASSFSGWSTGGYEAVKVNLPLEIFGEAAAGIGFTNIPTDSDGVNRRVILTETLGGHDYPSFAALSVATGNSYWSVGEIATHVPVTGDGEMFVNFSPDFNEATPAYSSLDVLEGRFNPDAFRQKAV
ncbi:MAG: CHASE2 domain-containing protein, partial [Actinobacteria bacterium]|nr:CHASE2 domain-containing protein [Actinomycetota bacterium]